MGWVGSGRTKWTNVTTVGERGEACGVARPSATAEHSVCGRDNAVGLTSILHRGRFISLDYVADLFVVACAG